MHESPLLPSFFCWTRFGTEAGESIEAIIERKERERRTGGGVFFWGIGNSVAPGIAELVRRTASPEVLFSPIISRPRAVDVLPAALVRWHGGLTLGGERMKLPGTARVISRQSRSAHYALVCGSAEPLRLGNLGQIKFGGLRNLVSGNPLGASQVTAVVERVPGRDNSRDYVIALRLELVAPYFIRLVDPIVQVVDAQDERAQAA
jgi:hypothetical protein